MRKTMKKSIVVLSMYDNLLGGKEVNINNCCADYGISVSTFYRYIAVLREYVWEKRKQEIVYDQKLNSYKLISTVNF